MAGIGDKPKTKSDNATIRRGARMQQLMQIRGFIPFALMVFLNAFVDLGHKIIIQNTIFNPIGK